MGYSPQGRKELDVTEGTECAQMHARTHTDPFLSAMDLLSLSLYYRMDTDKNRYSDTVNLDKCYAFSKTG